MVRKFEDAIKFSIANYDRERLRLDNKMGNSAVNHFKDSFKQQGFEDAEIEPWRPRKKNDGRQRAILVRTGRLRRSFTVSSTQNRIMIINDTPYSVYHNYGTRYLPQRRFMGPSKDLNKKLRVIIISSIKKAL